MNATHTKPVVLIVEDDLDILAMLREAFELANYSVFTAVNGCSAMLVTENKAPDVILLDLGLPEMDGEEFCRTLRRDFGVTPPIVMVSASTMLEPTCARLGLAHYMAKPFDIIDLIAHVDQARREARSLPQAAVA